MKKLLLFALIAVIFSACDKNEKTILPTEAEVSFSITDMMDGGLKDGWVGPDWQCAVDKDGNLIEPVKAEVIINGVTYILDVFRLDGKLYTQTLKLPVLVAPLTYTVTKFVLLDADGKISEMQLEVAPWNGEIFTVGL